MKARCWRLAAALLLAWTVPSLVSAVEQEGRKMPSSPTDSVAPADGGRKMPTSPTDPVPPAEGARQMPTTPAESAAIVAESLGVPASDSCKTGCRSQSCGARFWAWLTYQPLCQPNKCCKPAAMPCCAPRNYWFFPCAEGYGHCATGGYAAKSCGCQH